VHEEHEVLGAPRVGLASLLMLRQKSGSAAPSLQLDRVMSAGVRTPRSSRSDSKISMSSSVAGTAKFGTLRSVIPNSCASPFTRCVLRLADDRPSRRAA
jgi:hypothetical protein